MRVCVCPLASSQVRKAPNIEYFNGINLKEMRDGTKEELILPRASMPYATRPLERGSH